MRFSLTRGSHLRSRYQRAFLTPVTGKTLPSSDSSRLGTMVPYNVLANAEQDSQRDWGIPMRADLASKRLSSLFRHLPSRMISSSVIYNL